MASIADGTPASSILSREATIAGPGYNRWLVVPAALCIHLCIGMAYGFSVFWLPMSHLIAQPAAECANLGFFGMLTTTQCNWSVPAETHVFETFIAILGISAAIWGGWLERVGPRKAGFIAALCWGGGMALGGGCEIPMHCDRVVLAGEAYVGLVEVGVGLIPAAGGVKEMICKFQAGIPRDVVVPPLNLVQKAFENIATAKVSTSGKEAIENGHLLPWQTRVVLNRDHIIQYAKQEVLGLHIAG